MLKIHVGCASGFNYKAIFPARTKCQLWRSTKKACIRMGVCGWAGAMFLCLVRKDCNVLQFGFSSRFDSLPRSIKGTERRQRDNINEFHSFPFSRCLSPSYTHTHTLSGATGLFAAFKLCLGSSWNSFLLISFPVVALSKANRSPVFYLADFSLSLSFCSLPRLSPLIEYTACIFLSNNPPHTHTHPSFS